MRKITASAFLLAIAAFWGSAFGQNDAAEEYSRAELFSIIRNVQPGADVFALPSKFKFPSDARARSTFGVDFSHHQEDRCHCQLDWAAIEAAKVNFVYLKASQGTSFTDPVITENLIRIQKTTLPAGVYHFFTSIDTPTSQAQHFIAPECMSRVEWNLVLPIG
jgi:GH25 family lysozyme M1 (1,4-beta-N-acetylmuramidase)